MLQQALAGAERLLGPGAHASGSLGEDLVQFSTLCLVRSLEGPSDVLPQAKMLQVVVQTSTQVFIMCR